jgi:putative flavoprotein involved in K+ transport
MTTENIDTVIIGAGQAGLSAAYHLRKRGRDCLVLDSYARVGDNWRCHWDSLKLYSPARNDALPGLPFPAPRWHYPGKDEMGDYLQAYASKFELPVRNGVRVRSVRAVADGYLVTTYNGEELMAANVIVATGTFGRTPKIPDFADQLDQQIVQCHSSEYQRPSQLQPGPVLVVGGSHSGGDIAYELAETHEVILSGRDTGQVPFRLGTRKARIGWPIVFFMFGHVLTRRTPIGRKEMAHIRAHGGPAVRVKREDLAARGVRRVAHRTTGVRDGLPTLADGEALDVRNIVWATGFVQDLSWIDLPVVGPGGWPLEHRGIVESAPGLYFTGLCFQSSARSMLVGGAGADAEHVVTHLIRKRPTQRIVAEASLSRSALAS